MILGSGIDWIEVARIARLLDHPRYGKRFRARVFTPEEIAFCERRRNASESYAARFAAKEATMKALGGFFPWQEVEVVRAPRSAPQLRLHGRAAERARTLGVSRLFVSLSHSRDFAVAWVVAET